MRYALDPLNNNPTVFAMNVADDENDDDNHEHDPVLQSNNDVEHHSNSEENDEVRCEDIFEECEELNLNTFFQDVVEDRPYYDIADLTQAQKRVRAVRIPLAFLLCVEETIKKGPWLRTSCRRGPTP